MRGVNEIRQNAKHPRVKLILFATAFLWLKTLIAYYVDFSLGVQGVFQHIILWLNPIAFGLFFYSLSLLVSKEKHSRRVLLLLVVLQTLILYGNILFYREFSDFLTAKSLFSSQSFKMTGMTGSLGALMKWYDFIYWIDLPLIVWAAKKKFLGREQSHRFNKRYGLSLAALAVVIFGLNLQLAEISRPQLLLRTFDRNYLVKYLGLDFFSGWDVAKAVHANKVRAEADESEMEPIMDYIKKHQVQPNPETFGIAKGRNVVVLHLESIQQFLIDYKAKDENGKEVEATPFLNSLYHSNDCFSFSNVFHQVGQGKSSDAELMLENSIFGLSQGSAVSQFGSDNTFQAAPNILRNNGNYTSAVFHGNVGSFWNRNDSYKKWGVDYFFDSQYYALNKENSLEYGLKDKLFFRDSIPYLEQLPQPFYSKMITVSNHFPFPYEEKNASFPKMHTKDETVNGYFNTAHYADQALKEFFDYMKKAGLLENTVFVFYGDHYGISNSRNKALATALPNADAENWGDFNNAQIQRIPALFYIPGISKKGVKAGIQSTFGGQIDMLPTLLHLLGIKTDQYAMFGHDLLAKDHPNEVIFRNGTLVTPKYTVIQSKIYDTKTGEELTDRLTEEEKAAITAKVEEAQKPLDFSSEILSNDLLRFYQPEGFKAIDQTTLNYSDNLSRLDKQIKSLGKNYRSVLSQHGNKTTYGLYKTDAPELESTIKEAKAKAKKKGLPDYNTLAEKAK